MLDDSVIDDLLVKLDSFTIETNKICQNLRRITERISDLGGDIFVLQCHLQDAHLKTQQEDVPIQSKDQPPFESSLSAALRNAKIISGQMHGQPKICISEEDDDD